MKKRYSSPGMTVSQLAAALNGDRNGDWINIPGPGHRSRDRSLGIIFDPKAPEGFRVNSFADDDREICRAYVRKLLKEIKAGGIKARIDNFPVVTGAAGSKMEIAEQIWSNAQPIKGSLAETYLQGRGCVLTPPIIAADTLRFHPECPFGQHRFPALIARMTDALTGEFSGIQRTALRDDGPGKRLMPGGGSARRMLGVAKGSIVRLQPGSVEFGIAEGVETALSAIQIFKMPVIATLSASGMKALPVLNEAKFLRILADHDEAGIAAARECKRRYKRAGIEVEVRYPPTSGADWNDHLMKEISHADQNHKEEGTD